MKKTNNLEKEYKGQFPSKNCECHYQEPYGFVPEADCPEHDTKQFSDFLEVREKSLLKKQREEIVEIEKKYYELIMAVENKYKGETRHETALRLIKDSQKGSNKAYQSKITSLNK